MYSKIKLGKISKIGGGKRVPKGDVLYTEDTELKYIRARDIHDGVIDPIENVYISEKTFNKIKNYRIFKDEICVTIAGNIGFVAFVNDNFDGVCFTENAAKIKIINDRFVPKFVYYSLSTNIIKREMENIAAGAAQPKLGLYKLKELEIYNPSKPSQQKIASILSAYDDLIENNNKRIKILEEIGKNLFLQLTKKISRDEIELSEILKLKSGYAFKSKDFNKQNTNNIVVRMGNFPPGGGLQFEDNMMYLSDVGPEKYLLKGGDLVMVLSDVTRDGRIIGNVGFIPQDNENNYYLNQRVSKIESEKENLFFLYELFNSSKFKSYCLSRANSATVLNLSNVHIYSYKVIMPSKVELSDFNKSIEPIINLIQNLTKKNKILKKSKNLLLPKLISGELDVEGLDIKIRPEIL